MRRLRCLVLIFPLACVAHDPMQNPGMKLYLASAAVNVLDEIVSRLPFPPKGKEACYITTAGNLEGEPPWMTVEIEAVESAGFGVRRVDLAQLSPQSVAEAFRGCDLIWVGGGNTYLLLQEVRRSGFDQLVTRLIGEGVPYVGTSAGSLILAPDLECIGPAEVHPDLTLELTSFEGLNVFPLLPLVHFDNPMFRPLYRDILRDALDNDVPFVAVRDHEFILVEGERWRIVSSK